MGTSKMKTYRSTLSAASCWPLAERVWALNVSRRLTGSRDDPGMLLHSQLFSRDAGALGQRGHYTCCREDGRRLRDKLAWWMDRLLRQAAPTGSHAVVAEASRGCPQSGFASLPRPFVEAPRALLGGRQLHGWAVSKPQIARMLTCCGISASSTLVSGVGRESKCFGEAVAKRPNHSATGCIATIAAQGLACARQRDITPFCIPSP